MFRLGAPVDQIQLFHRRTRLRIALAGWRVVRRTQTPQCLRKHPVCSVSSSASNTRSSDLLAVLCAIPKPSIAVAIFDSCRKSVTALIVPSRNLSMSVSRMGSNRSVYSGIRFVTAFKDRSISMKKSSDSFCCAFGRPNSSSNTSLNFSGRSRSRRHRLIWPLERPVCSLSCISFGVKVVFCNKELDYAR